MASGRGTDTHPSARQSIAVGQKVSKDDLAAALLRQVKLVEQEAAKWPSDQYEAYRMVAQQILEAFSTPVVALK